MTLIRKGEDWAYKEDENFPLNQSFVVSMLWKVAELTAERYVGDAENSLSIYGLDHPSNRIVVTEENQEKIILLGAINSATGDSYMMVEGLKKVYTVDSTFRQLFSTGITEMAIRETLPGIKLEDIQELSVSGKENITFFREDNSEEWVIKTVDGEQQADSELVKSLMAKFLKIRYDEMKVYSPSERELTEYGLTEPEMVLKIQYSGQKYEDRCEYTMRIGKSEPTNEGTNQNVRYVYSEKGNGIYIVKESNLVPFMQLEPEDYLSLDLAPIPKKELKSLTILTKERRYTFEIQRSVESSKETVYLNGSEITETEFNRFYYPLYAFSAEKRVSDITDQLKEDPVLSMTYERTEEAGGQLVVTLIPYDQNYYGASVDGKAVLLVNRQRVNSLLYELEGIGA